MESASPRAQECPAQRVVREIPFQAWYFVE
jgi:hypothetical protein